MLMTHGRQCDLQEPVDWSIMLEVPLCAECLWVSVTDSILVCHVENYIAQSGSREVTKPA
jgi:hypothetical protein